MHDSSGFTDELLSRVSLAAIIGRRLTWDASKTRTAKGDYWACCPFHSEKTPSFHVDDHKGVYHCFGCQESGNAITFVRKIDNLDYRDALAYLADIVGMRLPTQSKADIAAADDRKKLYEICEQAARFFSIALSSHSGTGARRYLESREVSETTRNAFEIGFAPDSWSDLTDQFLNRGVSLELLVEAGLTAKSDSGRAPYDRFRNRIIFPIRDLRGRMVGFGGRALSSTDRAKYLNSPETPIFSKGAILYNHLPARNALKNSGPLVVAEGYMDVIRLSQAGMETSVAPLGTAVTESQLRHLWRLDQEPVLALDGDNAGRMAADRAMRKAFPLLEPGNSLRFCFLPEDTDPDDFVRRFGIDALREQLGKATPLAEFLWGTTQSQFQRNTPESRAAFQTELRRIVSTIENREVQFQYQQYFRELQRDTQRSPGRARRRLGTPLPETMASPIAAARKNDTVGEKIRESVILGVCVTVPEAARDVIDRLELLEFSDSRHRRMLDLVVTALSVAELDRDAFRARIRREIGDDTLDKLLSSHHLKRLHGGSPLQSDENTVEKAKFMLLEEISKIESTAAARREHGETVCDAKEGSGGQLIGKNSLLARYGEVVRGKRRAQRGIEVEKAQDSVTAANGVVLDRSELDEFNRLTEFP